MSQVQTGVRGHDDTVKKSYGTVLGVLAGTPTQKTVDNAYVTHYRACIASALANNCGVEPFITALRTLGANP